MSQIFHPDVAHVADVLDTVGQKYRVQRLARGAMLTLSTTAVAGLVAGLLAHWSGAGAYAMTALVGWSIVAGASALVWLVRPMLLRPRLEWVARLVEQRVEGLHNGLTNTLLLAGRDDVRSSPLTPLIYAEIRDRADHAAIGQAVKFRELAPIAWRCGIILLLCVVAGLLLRGQLAHGWKQMFAPSAFVPASAEARLTSVRPGDVTLIKGQPLEVLLEIAGVAPEQTPEARLFVEPPIDGKSQISIPNVAPDRFAARIEHVDQTMRYRVEVDGTQSRWFDVKVVEQIKLTGLSLTITPPAYTRLEKQQVKINPDALAPVTAQQGSVIEVVAQIDNAVGSAMLQAGDEPPVSMERQNEGRQFIVSTPAQTDRSLAILLADGSGQILARLPEPGIDLRVTPDAAPAISMKWPMQDVALAPDAEATVQAHLKDDIGLAQARLLMGAGAAAPLEPVADIRLEGQTTFDLSQKLALRADQKKHGAIVRVQVEATDNRALSEREGAQIVLSPVYEIRFQEASEIARESARHLDELREVLRELLKKQQDLQARTVALKTFGAMEPITRGQTELRDRMMQVAETFAFEPSDANVQKTLLVLARNSAQEAIDYSSGLASEPGAQQQIKLHAELQARQRRIISTLESLLAMLTASPELVDAKLTKGGDLPTQKEMAKDLKAALDEYVKQQQKLLDQTAPLAKTPVDDFTEKDRKALEDLLMSQEKLDAFMQEKISDFSKLAEQDMANASLLKELLEVYSEVTMAKDALKKKEIEIAVSAEEMGVELAKEISSNLEKWLVDEPDRIKWDQEDPLTQTDVPMAQLPEELEDMIGELMEQQEDILEEAEDTNANWTDSLDKGAGWDAMDGPIANMSAKGVTGNQLPNNNEMGGRSGEGRSGKSQGEFVEESATGKGGRNTPTRLDPTAFQQGQINDQSKDPVGGATGGGKLSGQGGAGLEGPVPQEIEQKMQRLKQKQAELRNAAERLNLRFQLGKYDNFKLLQSIAMMRRVEADLDANRYQNALRRKDVLLDTLETSRLLVGGEIHVQHDTSPTLSTRMEGEIHDAMKGELPPAWSDALKTYYEKLGRQ